MSRARALEHRPRKMARLAEKIRTRFWFAGKTFSTDWTSKNLPVWRQVLAPLRKQPVRILEIGSWEGRSAVYLLKLFREGNITCVDTFAGGREHAEDERRLSRIEKHFDRNLAPFGARVRKIKATSAEAMQILAAEGAQFGLIYVDGSHMRDDVAADSAAAWPLLAPHGVLIWDDYGWGHDLPDEQQPKPAIDAFLAAHAGQYRLLWQGYQVMIEKAG